MIVYLLLLTAILILGIAIHPGKTEKRKKRFLWFSFVLLVMLSGFRDVSGGVDTASYVALFQNIDLLDFNLSRFEPGFLYYVKLVHSISDNVSFFLFVNSIFCIGLPCIFVYKYSEEACLSVLLFITLKSYFFQMTGLRQAMAIAFVLTAFIFILKKRSKMRCFLAILMILLAASFHTIAILAIVPYIIWIWPNRRFVDMINPKATLRWTIILSFIAFVSFPYIMRLVGMILPQYTLYFSGTWSDSNYSASLFKFLIQLIFLAVGVYYIQRKKQITDVDRLSMLMLMASVIVATLAMRMEIWGRLLGLFSIYTSLIWVPSFVSVQMNGKDRIILKSLIVLFSLAYMIVTFVFRPEWDGVVPYMFIK